MTAVLGRFKEKERSCRACKATWKDHEEKETDVNIGLALARDAYENCFDRAVLITGDSDLTPAVRLVKAKFTRKSGSSPP